MAKKYIVWFPFHCTVRTEVEAETKEEEIEKAQRKVHPMLCHQCSDEIEIGDCVDSIDPEVYEED